MDGEKNVSLAMKCACLGARDGQAPWKTNRGRTVSRRRRRALLVALLWSGPGGAAAIEQIVVLAVTQGQAIVRIDGARRVLAEGETSPEGARLVAADSAGIVLEIDGVRGHYPLRAVLTPITPQRRRQTQTLWADREGFFFGDGAINGAPVRFLVDTGANTVALSSRDAQRLGIDYRGGQRGAATTANGPVPMYSVFLHTVRLGGITLNNVRAGVVEGNYPDVPLLGMSFLKGLEMRRDGNRMELIRKY